MARKDSATVEDTAPESDIQIEDFEDLPTELRGSGGGRARKPNEFDQHIEGWAESGRWKKIKVPNEERQKEVFNALKRAANAAGYGLERHPQEKDGELFVWVKIRPKQKRGPEVGSKRVDGFVYGPDELDDDGNPTPEAVKAKKEKASANA